MENLSVPSQFSMENIALDFSSRESVIEATRRIKNITERILLKIEITADDSANALHDLQMHTVDLAKEIKTLEKVQKETKILNELQKESIDLIKTDHVVDQNRTSVTEQLFNIQKQMTTFARSNLAVKNATPQDMPTSKEEQPVVQKLLQLQSENIELMKNVEAYQREDLIDIQTNITRFWSSILTTQDLHKREDKCRLKDSGVFSGAEICQPSSTSEDCKDAEKRHAMYAYHASDTCENSLRMESGCAEKSETGATTGYNSN